MAGSDGAVATEGGSSYELELMADADDIAYPKSFLLLGMLLFKDILPILAVQHLDSE